jgi:hypothetical protein
MVGKMRLLVSAALTIGISVPACAEENFKILKGKQIRARVVGKDISADIHWSEYYRKDGVLISVDMGAADRHLENPGGQALQIQNKVQSAYLL